MKILRPKHSREYSRGGWPERGKCFDYFPFNNRNIKTIIKKSEIPYIFNSKLNKKGILLSLVWNCFANHMYQHVRFSIYVGIGLSAF